jgi:hypothetical protein
MRFLCHLFMASLATALLYVAFIAFSYIEMLHKAFAA